MYYRLLGNTGLQVSVLSFGFWATFGVKEDLNDQAGIERAKDILRVARANGINLFDNVETYGNPRGEAERIMGEAIAELRKEDAESWRRSSIIITTKIFWGGTSENEQGLSRKHINEGMAASLKRLQVDYVDLVFCHRPDPFTPTETVVRAMSDLVRSGKATAWGTSEWSAQQITEAVWIAKTQGCEPPQFEQPQYHMFCRDKVEAEYFPLFREPYKLGTTIWSPLAAGLLTGKYNDGVPEGSRLAQSGFEWLAARLKAWQEGGQIDKVRRLSAYAAESLGCSVTQLAVAWCVKNPNVSTVLLGASSVAQLEENLGALRLVPQLSKAHMDAIEAILGNKPEEWAGYGGAGMRKLVTI